MKKNLFLLICLFIINFANAQQDVKLDWSKKIAYDRKTTGNLVGFVGATTKYVYADMMPTFHKLAKTQRTLIVYDKNTMQQIGKINLKTKADFKDIEITEDAVYVLSIDDEKGKEILYAQTYTPNLSVISGKKKIFQITTSTRGGSKMVNSIKTYSNAKANGNLYIVAEKPNVKGSNVVVQYNVIDNKLNSIATGQITLPVESKRNTIYNLSSFRVGDDGKLISRNFISLNRDERKKEKIKSASYSLLSVIDPEEKSIKSLPIKSAGKHIGQFDYFTKDGKMNIVGLYDEDDGKRSERGRGVFSAILNTETGELENSHFLEIDDPKINHNLLYLEAVKRDSNNTLTLYAGEELEYTRTTTTRSSNGTTSTRTTYYTDKSDVLIVNINEEGSLNWKKVLDRRITYQAWGVRDLHVMEKGNTAVMTYADVYKKSKSNGKKRFSFFNRKNRKELRDNIAYAKINKTNGNLTRGVVTLNKANVDKKDRKMVNAANVMELDNILYFDGFQLRPKNGFMIGTCATTVVCFPIGIGYYYIKMRNGSGLTGGGYLGSLKIKE